jgi:hypothetical protein
VADVDTLANEFKHVTFAATSDSSEPRNVGGINATASETDEPSAI